jgi:hypothetical protein
MIHPDLDAEALGIGLNPLPLPLDLSEDESDPGRNLHRAETPLDEDDSPAEDDPPNSLLPNVVNRANAMASAPQGNQIISALRSNLDLSEADLLPIQNWPTVSQTPHLSTKCNR